jgi:hypothetical protein
MIADNTATIYAHRRRIVTTTVSLEYELDKSFHYGRFGEAGDTTG